MHRRFAFLALVLLIVGCERVRSRAQGPFLRQTQPYAGAAPAAQPLAISGSAQPLPPVAPDEMPLVPPRPPEPGALPKAIAPPQSVRPPEVKVEDAGVVAAVGLSPQQPKKPVAAAPSPQAMNLAAIKKISTTLADKLKLLGNYEARFTRRENLDGTPGKIEEVIFRFRAEPMAVYMKNVSEVGKGREVLYNPSQHGDKIHVIIGEGDTRFLRVGAKGPSLSPDAPQIRAKSRHTIRESGIAISGNRFIAAVAKLETGRLPNSLKYAGLLKRDEFGDTPLEGVEETIRKGDQEGVPDGGTRHWFFDAKPDSPSFGLPVLVILYDAAGKELEYYKYTQLRSPTNFTDADFDPARLGKK
ncbi:MAG TPA: DUF1571 domain-containing protein [Urbifossiella sp.]